MHLYVASIENPSDFQPTFHVNYGSKLHWLDLEKHGGTLAHSDKDLSSYRWLRSGMRGVLIQRFNGFGTDREGNHWIRIH